MRFRWVVIALTLGAFGSAIAAFTQVQQQFFPTSSRPELFIEIRMPEGTSIGVTEAAAKKAEALIKGDADLEYYTTYIGEGSPRFFLALESRAAERELRAHRHDDQGGGGARAARRPASKGWSPRT